jgi:hypothetical protein
MVGRRSLAVIALIVEYMLLCGEITLLMGIGLIKTRRKPVRLG